MRSLAFLLALPIALQVRADTTVQPVTEVSPQQAILRYQTTVAPITPCMWTIKEAVSGPMPDDVNPSIFFGSNFDSRPGSIITGQNRAFVFGQRTSALGLDKLLHSRSAKANTRYNATVSCGTDSPVTVSFTTSNIPLGQTYSEQPPFSTFGFGNYAWPGIQWNDQTVEYPDPQTGAIIKRVTSPGWLGRQQALANFDFAIGGSGWISPGNILKGSGCTGNSGTCAQTNNSSSMFLAIHGRSVTPQYGPYDWQPSGFWPNFSYDDWLLSLTGSARAAGTQVSVCLSFYDSGVTCNSAAQTITLGTGVKTVGFPAASSGVSGGQPIWSPTFNATEWGGAATDKGMHKGDFAFAYGCPSACPNGWPAAGIGVTTNGTSVTVACAASQAPMSCFNPLWNNSYLYIQGSGCTDGGTDVCQLNGHPSSTQTLTLMNAPANDCSTACNWASLASGFKIMPPGGVQIDIGAQYAYALSPMFQLQAEGDSQTCNPVPVTVSYAADGITPVPPVSANLCFAAIQNASNYSLAYGQLYLLIPSTGEVRYISPLWTPAGADSGDASGDQNFSQIAFVKDGWDGQNPNCIYGIGQAKTGMPGTVGGQCPGGQVCKTSIFQACYNTAYHWAAYSHPLWAPAGFAAGQNPATGGRWPDDPMVYTNVTKPSANQDLLTQMAANNSYYDAVAFPYCNLDRIVAGYAFMVCSANGQNTWAVISSFQLATGNNAANGNTFTAPGIRNMGFHSSFQADSVGYYVVVGDPPASNPATTGAGPFQITPYSMLKSSVYSNDTSMTSTSPADACPANPYGAVQCVTFRTQDMCSHSPTPHEAAKWPCPYNSSWSQPILNGGSTSLQAGDAIVLNSSAIGGFNENLQVLRATPTSDPACAADCIEVIAGRGMWTTGLQNSQAGWTGMMTGNTGTPNPWPVGNGGFASYTAAATTGPFSWIADPHGGGYHNDAGVAPAAGHMTIMNSNGSSRYNITPQSGLGSWDQNAAGPYGPHTGAFTGSFMVNLLPPFGGVTANGMMQGYPSNEQTNAVSNFEKNWALDFKAINGSGAAGAGEVYQPIEPVTATLVSGTTSVYKFTAITGQIPANEANYKLYGLVGTADRWLAQDVSGPNSSVSDATPYQVCMVLAAGECYAGSNVGEVYETVPNVPSLPGYCVSTWLTESYPCAGFKTPYQGWLIQYELDRSYQNGEYLRRFTSGLSGLYRQQGSSTFIAETTGKWGMFKADWADGIRSEIFMVKLPPFEGSASAVPLNTFVNYPVSVPSGATYAEIEFGYMENGPAEAHYCTGRQEPCTTSGSPFVFPSIDKRVPVSCSGGCTINIPMIPGRAVYYSVGTSADGTSWNYGTRQVGLGQAERAPEQRRVR